MELNRKLNNWAALVLPQENYQNTVIYNEKDGVGFLTFKPYVNMPFITHGFSTRVGGVSKGHFSSMNLSFSRGDDDESVAENYRRIAKAMDINVENMTGTKQTHTTVVIEADKSLKGNGITRPQILDDVDGLVTSEKNICLVTSYADCVPLFFVDVKKHVIGLSHSGWRGTAGNICRSTAEQMKKLYNTDAGDIVTFIGPSICNECYEVSMDLIEPFGRNFDENEMNMIFEHKGNGKYLLNLSLANVLNMKKAGIPPENIYVTDVCTCCNSNILFSHRASHGLRGGMCGFLQLN